MGIVHENFHAYYNFVVIKDKNYQKKFFMVSSMLQN